MKNSLKQQVLDPFLDFIFPKFCWHCAENLTSKKSHLICQKCLLLLDLIDPLSSCPKCFSPDFQVGTSYCSLCHKAPSFITAAASVFDYEGPAETFVKKLKYNDKTYLAEILASFMVMQLCRLKWPMPDCIVPVPISKMRLMCRGYNQSLLLAKEMGNLLDRPVYEPLRRKSGDYSQASLGYKERTQLNGNSLFFKGSEEVQDRKILLVDDVMTSGSTLRKCAEVLMEGCPQEIYALTVCRS